MVLKLGNITKMAYNGEEFQNGGENRWLVLIKPLTRIHEVYKVVKVQYSYLLVTCMDG